jgi:RHS repeat-associated protein
LQTVADNRLANSTTYTYDDSGRVLSFVYPNGIKHTFAYGSLDWPTNLDLTRNGTSVASYAQTYGDSGHKLSVNENGSRLVNYGYDQTYRLLSEAFGSGSLVYTLDPVGNRTNRVSTLPGLPSLVNAYDANDRLTVDSYDDNGNTLSRGGNTYAYDFEDHLTNFNSGLVAMTYDGDGNRVARTEGGVTTRYLIDDLTPTGFAQVAEELQRGVVVRRYTHGAQRISLAQLDNGAWSVRYYGYDPGANVRQLTDETGTVTDTYTYDAFGSVVSSSGTTSNAFLYRAEYFDQVIGAYYLRARWYVPSAARFVTKDLEAGYLDVPGSLHKYNYGEADPVNKLDPSGRGIISYAWNVAKSVAPALRSVDAIACYVSVGIAIGNIVLYDAEAKMNVGMMGTITSCMTVGGKYFGASLLPRFELSVSLIGCAASLRQTEEDIAEYYSLPESDNRRSALRNSIFDTVFGCGVALFGAIPQSYYY